MRAFLVVWRAIVALYNDLFPLVGLSLLWWVTGGIFVAVAVVIGWPLFAAGGPWWVAPLAAIPAGPATAAMAAVARRCARGISIDRSHYFEGFKRYWRPALAISAIGMVGLALLGLNLVFYFFQANDLLRALTFLWAYGILFWLGVQIFVYPFLVSLEHPTIRMALRNALAATFANPLFSLLLLVIACALTALSIVLPILLLFIWPALDIVAGGAGDAAAPGAGWGEARRGLDEQLGHFVGSKNRPGNRLAGAQRDQAGRRGRHGSNLDCGVAGRGQERTKVTGVSLCGRH